MSGEVLRERPHLVAVERPISLTRATPAELALEVSAVVASPIVSAVLTAIGGGVLLLNAHRQIVAANLESLVPEHEDAARKALGLRPGEALGCIHAAEEAGGCGGAEACRMCGALRTILGCQSRHLPVDGECLVTTGNGELIPLELRLRASPVEVAGRQFTVLAIRDASDEKRRRILEKIFFHDVLNTLTGLTISAEVLLRAPAERSRVTAERIARQVKRLEAEVVGQRTLLDAEHGTLQLELTAVSARSALREVVAGFCEHPLAARRTLSVLDSPGSPEVEVRTDAALLMRILTNMLTNALEATGEGGVVRAWCSVLEPGPWACVFHVHNEAVIPRHVALHVFQRSFSTKSRTGRGLGTYGMKLLGERYLGGAVRFTSREGEGTTFSLGLPREPPCVARSAPLDSCF